MTAVAAPPDRRPFTSATHAWWEPMLMAAWAEGWLREDDVWRRLEHADADVLASEDATRSWLDELRAERVPDLGPVGRLPAVRQLVVRHVHLERRVAELEQLLTAMADEIRTRRLVVVDADGGERVLVEAGRDEAAVTVRCRDRDDREESFVQLVASDDSTSSAGVFLSGGGNGAATFYVEDAGEGLPHTSIVLEAPGQTGGRGVVIDHVGLRNSDTRIRDEMKAHEERCERNREAYLQRREREFLREVVLAEEARDRRQRRFA